MKAEDFDLCFRIRSPHVQGKEKAIQLGIGQRECACRGEVVFGSNNKKRTIKFPGFPVDGNLALAHGFQQCTLSPGAGAVNFVGEDELAKNRTFVKYKILSLLIIDAVSDNIGREKIGSELDSREKAIYGGGKYFAEGGFAQTGCALNQHMSIGQDSDQKKFSGKFCAKDTGNDVVVYCLDLFIQFRPLDVVE